MELKHIPLDQLHLASVNMRHGKKAPDISDICPPFACAASCSRFWSGPTTRASRSLPGEGVTSLRKPSKPSRALSIPSPAPSWRKAMMRTHRSVPHREHRPSRSRRNDAIRDLREAHQGRPQRRECGDNVRRHGSHRQAAARTRQSVAQDRLLVAHAVASSGNWSVKPDAQRTQNNAIRASIEKSKAQAAFEAERDTVETLLAFAEDGDSRNDLTTIVFLRLLKMSDAEVSRVAAFVMANTLAVGSEEPRPLASYSRRTLATTGKRMRPSSNSFATARP